MSALYFALTKRFLQPLPLLLLLVGVSLATLSHRFLRRRLSALRRFSPWSPPVRQSWCIRWRAFGMAPSAVGRRSAGRRGARRPRCWTQRAGKLRLRPELTDDTRDRCLHAAELDRRDGPRLDIVSGGMLVPGSSEPSVPPAMRDLLVQLGVSQDDVILESRATTTYENATDTCCRVRAGASSGRGRDRGDPSATRDELLLRRGDSCRCRTLPASGE